MSRLDYIIVGGGIVGLSVAAAILNKNPNARLVLLEKENDWAQHQTGRNSGVIHSGIYYKPGSLKAALCKQGSRQLREFCDTHGIPYELCGKVIVATKQEEIGPLENLYQRGIANGLEIRRLTAEQVCEIEPHVRCLAGLQIPSTGIVDYTQVCRKLSELIQQNGAELRLNTEVQKIRTSTDEVVIETNREQFEARWVINCAGLHSDRVARLSGAQPEAKIVPFRGEYYELRPERRSLVRNLIYPVPDPQFPFLGVHFTRGIDGSVHAGPNAVLSFKREGYSRTSFDFRDFVETMAYPGFWRLATRHVRAGLAEMHRSFSKHAFVESLRNLIPEIQEDDLVPGGAGVRAQALRRDGSLVDDFLIQPFGRAIHVCNAPSPAATAALEIGREIVRKLPNQKNLAIAVAIV